MTATPTYAALWCRSNYSFLDGASHPEEYFATAGELGITSMALTDRDGIYGIVKAHTAAKANGVKLIIGSQITVVEEGSTSSIVLLVQSHEGYRNLCRLITRGRRRCEKGRSEVRWQEVAEHSEGLMALWGGDESLLTREETPTLAAHLDRAGDLLREAFPGRLYAMIPRHHRASEYRQECLLRSRAARWEMPLVAATEVLYHQRDRRPLHDVVTCLRHHTTLREARNLLKPNDEHALLSPAEFAHRYADEPYAIARTLDIAEQCTFSLDDIRYRYPEEELPNGMNSFEWLEQLTWQGARRRYPDAIPREVSKQLRKELALIRKLDYSGYFLTMHEIVRYCQQNDILCQGRGSAANSAVCFCLGITAVDPVKMELLFERFISEERAEPPDIDLDIEHHRREEVIQHTYERYGRDHAAMVAVVIRYRMRSAIRDVGKVLGIEETTIDRLTKIYHRRDKMDDETYKQSGLNPHAPVTQHLMSLVAELIDTPRHLSIHPGGFLLGHEPVHDLVPIENGTMADRTVIQWEKDDVEALNLFKVDLLGLGGLSLLRESFELLQEHYDEHWSMATIPFDDERTFDMICEGDTVGVFQIESRAQMAMLPRLRPREFYDLVIEVAIVRPGPITGGMVHPYLRRRNGEEPVTYPHPDLEPVLKRTLGVPLFQEQVMRIATVAADYTPGEADQLRRDMAAWKKSGAMEKHKQKLIARMEKKGISGEFAERVFQQIQGFGSYGFPESHAASFALITYATSWVRANYPEIFVCAALNAQPFGFYTVATILGDAKRHGVAILPVDVTRSGWNSALERQPDGTLAVRVGLRTIKGLQEREVRELLHVRETIGVPEPLALVRQSLIGEEALVKLAEAGAFDALTSNRRRAVWEIRGACKDRVQEIELVETGGLPLFPELSPPEQVQWDYRTSNHSARGHPIELWRDELTQRGLPTAEQVGELTDGQPCRYAGVVICRQRPGTASGVVFLTMEDETGFVNVVVWPKVYEQYRTLLKTEQFLLITGRMEGDTVKHLIARTIATPPVGQAIETAKSRDFH